MSGIEIDNRLEVTCESLLNPKQVGALEIFF